ncbi:hypothetical protein JX266_005346 [Neoarthrinium moseri]|uniref:uncharacterized protein n=1 Tax=Neoarthrinium moseri TaxID=1658444 RepID=UPI001FDC7B76|nr:uncharacterized protein JN550_007424 [Neoarthrinium moseri]KAI1848918.1 hypothetical protein JX266_005346 [Neoarthrinium moseri]KAI1866877.1 hypothetical protein JN550_007424 [Neoarthrinium moseri]
MSLIAVHNHVALFHINIAPSTFIASFTLSLFFFFAYLVISGFAPAVRFPSINPLPRLFRRAVTTAVPEPVTSPALEWKQQKALPAVPQQDRPTLQLTDYEHNSPAASPGRSSLRSFFSSSRRASTSSNPTTKGRKRMTAYKHDPHQLDASLDDFRAPLTPPPTLPPSFVRYPSARSGFAQSSSLFHSTEDEDEAAMREAMDENASDLSSLSGGGYSPPAWRRLENGNRSSGFWRPSDNLLGLGTHGRRREESPPMDDYFEDRYRSGVSGGDEDALEQAIRTRLPTGSLNIRFAVRADIQQRTEPIETAIKFVRSKMHSITKSWANIIVATLVALLSITTVRSLFQPASQRPVPDLVKVAGIARSFEPLIYYSENGVSQVGDLQATGVAVWDLGESVRSSNMTSAPIIVKSLDELSDSLKTLAVELTRFFANVDGDIDGILIVMDWARRELTQLQGMPSPPLATAWANIHNVLCDAGVLENPATGTPTRLGAIATSVFGMSQPQRTRSTLQRTFSEFLSVLEDAINNELQHSLALFGLFEAIDRQFLNLARVVVRESSLQEDRHADDLSSLWTRILGPKASEVKKYERNRQLLQNVREKTVMNKGILVEHNGKLLTLKANLESLRRKLVSPLVRSVNSSTLSLEGQIKGLEDVGVYLEGVRTRQKGKLMEMLYGSGSARPSVAGGAGGGSRMIEENRWGSGS